MRDDLLMRKLVSRPSLRDDLFNSTEQLTGKLDAGIVGNFLQSRQINAVLRANSLDKGAFLAVANWIITNALGNERAEYRPERGIVSLRAKLI